MVVANELFANNKSLCQAFGARLRGVGKIDAPLLAVAQQRLEPGKIARRRDDEDVADAAQHQHRQRIIDQRLVVDWKDLLGDRQRHRIEPRAASPGKDDGFHAASSLGLQNQFVETARQAFLPRPTVGCRTRARSWYCRAPSMPAGGPGSGKLMSGWRRDAGSSCPELPRGGISPQRSHATLFRPDPSGDRSPTCHDPGTNGFAPRYRGWRRQCHRPKSASPLDRTRPAPRRVRRRAAASSSRNLRHRDCRPMTCAGSRAPAAACGLPLRRRPSISHTFRAERSGLSRRTASAWCHRTHSRSISE